MGLITCNPIESFLSMKIFQNKGEEEGDNDDTTALMKDVDDLSSSSFINSGVKRRFVRDHTDSDEPLNETTFRSLYSSNHNEIEETEAFISGHRQSAFDITPSYSWRDIIQFPIINTLKSYDRSKLLADFSASLILTAILIPQAMSYAVLADLPPVHGLYCSIFPPVIYALLGTYRHLSVGSFALVSLMFGDAIIKLMPSDDSKLVTASYLTLCVGLISTLLGLFRLGGVDIFMSDSNISGVYAASGISIATSQLKYFFGLNKMPRYQDPFSVIQIYYYIFSHLEDINILASIVGFVSLVFIIVAGNLEKKYWIPRFKFNFPSSLLVVIVTTGLSAYFHWDLPVVGYIPPGLPSLQLSSFDTGINIYNLIFSAFSLSVVIHLISISVGRSLALKYNCPPPVGNQELIAIGIGNICSSFSGGYTACASLSRSAVLASAGAASPLSGLMGVVLLIIVLQWLTSLFFSLPLASLGSIVMAALTGVLVEINKPKKFYKVRKMDGIVWIVSFLGVLLLGVEIGIIVGILCNVCLVLGSIISPNISILGLIRGTTFYRDCARYPKDAIILPNILIIRFEAPVLFLNCEYLSGVVRNLYLKRRSPLDSEITSIILDCGSINDIDNAGVTSFIRMKEEYLNKSVQFYLANCKGPERDILNKGGFEMNRIFVSTHDAVEYIQRQSQSPRVH